MAQINFTAIEIKDIEGNALTVDIARDLGNAMYMRGENIEECELGKRIYQAGKSNTPVELSEQEVKLVGKFTGGYSYIVREAITRGLEG